MKRYKYVLLGVMLFVLAGVLSCVKTKQSRALPDTSPVEFVGTCQEGDCLEGSGTMDLDGGGKYIGDFKQGKFNGQGTITLADGSSFSGSFRNGRYQGGGAVVAVDGRKGTCLKESDCLNGSGMITFEDKTVYDGRFRLGLLEGYGFISTP
ncbi:MAG: hypothetical protein KKD63_09065, partial [Proteobacteria bacterium]|nr:hypothetical protein [Desulfobulbaceae bacterium]MBU4153018.1 hypothetical protein [Pseudomonadota bacterium]